jgi:hypothetical protein
MRKMVRRVEHLRHAPFDYHVRKGSPEQQEIAALFRQINRGYRHSERFLVQQRAHKERERKYMRDLEAKQDAEQRRIAHQAWEMVYREGRTKREVEMLLDIDPDTLSDMLNGLSQERSRRMLHHAQDYVAMQLARLEWVIEQASQAYADSKAGKRTVERTVRDGEVSEVVLERIEQTKAGDPKFLQVVLTALKGQSDLLGLARPSVQINQQVVNLSARERMERLLKVIEPHDLPAPPDTEILRAQDADWSYMDTPESTGQEPS